MKKVPVIQFSEWLEAESKWNQLKVTPKPKGAITAEDFAKETGRSGERARSILNGMVKAGLATKEPWKNSGVQGAPNIFFLKKK